MRQIEIVTMMLRLLDLKYDKSYNISNGVNDGY